MKTKSSEKRNHILHKFLPRETREHQPPSQWWYREGNEVCVSCALLLFYRGRVAELEVLEIREEPNEVQDLTAGAFGCPEGKESKSRCEVSEVLLDVRNEAGHLKIIYPKLLEVRECGKVTQGAPGEPVGSELDKGIMAETDAKALDERK